MRTIVLALAVFIALACAASATVDFDEDYTMDLDEMNTEDGTAAGGESTGKGEEKEDGMDVFKVPKSVPRMELRDVASEVKRHIDTLERKRFNLTHKVRELQISLQDIEKRKAYLNKKIDEIRAKARKMREDAIARAKGELSDEEKKLQAEIDEHQKGIEWVNELRQRIGQLHKKATASKKATEKAAATAEPTDIEAKSVADSAYERAREWVKKELEEGTTKFPTLYIDTGVIASLQDIQDGCAAHADENGVMSDIAEGNMKMYESSHLKELADRMKDALKLKIKLAKEDLDKLRAAPVLDEHVQLSLAEYEKELAALREKGDTMQERLIVLKGTIQPKLDRIDNELTKLKGIQKQMYGGAEENEEEEEKKDEEADANTNAGDDVDVEMSEEATDDAEESEDDASSDAADVEESEEGTDAAEDSDVESEAADLEASDDAGDADVEISTAADVADNDEESDMAAEEEDESADEDEESD